MGSTDGTAAGGVCRMSRPRSIGIPDPKAPARRRSVARTPRQRPAHRQRLSTRAGGDARVAPTGAGLQRKDGLRGDVAGVESNDAKGKGRKQKVESRESSTAND